MNDDQRERLTKRRNILPLCSRLCVGVRSRLYLFFPFGLKARCRRVGNSWIQGCIILRHLQRLGSKSSTAGHTCRHVLRMRWPSSTTNDVFQTCFSMGWFLKHVVLMNLKERTNEIDRMKERTTMRVLLPYSVSVNVRNWTIWGNRA